MVSAVSLAWACVPGTSLTLSSSSGAPGTTVTATVGGFPADFPMEVRMNTYTGPLLAQSASRPAAGSFTLNITIPADTAAGCHLVIAFPTEPEHREHGLAPAAFKVVTEANPNPDCTTPPPPPPPPPPPAGAAPPPSSAIFNPVSPVLSQGRTINGTSASERLTGTPFADVINCGAGNDSVTGGGGNDVINCGAGRDRVSGGSGNDRVSGGPGNDKLAGSSGNDRVSGGSGKDSLSGGSGNDRLLGGSGNDTLKGNGGKDRLYGNGGADRLYRGGTDRLFGGSGENRIIG